MAALSLFLSEGMSLSIASKFETQTYIQQIANQASAKEEILGTKVTSHSLGSGSLAFFAFAASVTTAKMRMTETIMKNNLFIISN